MNFVSLSRFDPWSFLNAFKRKAVSLGAEYVNGEVVGFDKQSANLDRSRGPNKLQIQTKNGIQTLEFEHCVLATGYESGKVAGLAGIGTGSGKLGVGVPVEAK